MRERRVGFHWSLRGIRFRSTKESISLSRRSLSSIISSSEKVGLSTGMVDLEVWKLDGEAGGDEVDDNECDEVDDENDDSNNGITSSDSENVAMMETRLLQGTHRYYLSLSLFRSFFLLRRRMGLKRKSQESEVH